MAKTEVTVKKALPAKTGDAWQSFRDEMDRLFDRFSGISAFRLCAACSTPSRPGRSRARSPSRRRRSM